jgi:hypothetical protein
VPPGVAALCEASLTTCQDVFESCCSWAEGTDWVLAIPLVRAGRSNFDRDFYFSVKRSQNEHNRVFHFIEWAEQLDTYLCIILDWNIFFLTILCICFLYYLKAKFERSQLQKNNRRDMLNKYMFSILTKIIVIMIFP